MCFICFIMYKTTALTVHTAHSVTEIGLGMCTGNFVEADVSDSSNGIQRPPAGTNCVGPCVIASGRWGSSYCNTASVGGISQWGAECVPCTGMNFQDKF